MTSELHPSGTGTNSGYPSISPTELKQRLERGDEIVIIDVRAPSEFENEHVPGARNIPLHELSAARLELEGLRDRPVAVLCQGGARSKQGCELLMRAGVKDITNILGGTKGWREAGLPTIAGARAMSIERQVRIVAGMLVAFGGFGSLFITPAFVWLSIFVGCGLVFAGVTDTCGMALVLARAPWNRGVKQQGSVPQGRGHCCTGGGSA